MQKAGSAAGAAWTMMPGAMVRPMTSVVSALIRFMVAMRALVLDLDGGRL